MRSWHPALLLVALAASASATHAAEPADDEVVELYPAVGFAFPFLFVPLEACDSPWADIVDAHVDAIGDDLGVSLRLRDPLAPTVCAEQEIDRLLQIAEHSVRLVADARDESRHPTVIHLTMRMPSGLVPPALTTPSFRACVWFVYYERGPADSTCAPLQPREEAFAEGRVAWSLPRAGEVEHWQGGTIAYDLTGVSWHLEADARLVHGANHRAPPDLRIIARDDVGPRTVVT